MRAFWSYSFLFFLFLCPKECLADVCIQPGEVRPDSGYSFIRTELKALQWMRSAVAESQKIQMHFPSREDPSRIHARLRFYSVVQNVSDDYDCAKSLLGAYKDSKSENIRASVVSFVTSIDVMKQMNGLIVEMAEAVDKMTKVEDIDELDPGKKLAEINSVKKDAESMAMIATHLSTFSILFIDGEGEAAKPTAFTITSTQREKLLVEVREIAKQKSPAPYLDACVDMVLTTLLRALPTSLS